MSKPEWKVTYTDGKVAIRSNSFTHDAVLYLTGDFATHEVAISYASKLVAKLNADLSRIEAETEARVLGMAIVAVCGLLRNEPLPYRSDIAHDDAITEALTALQSLSPGGGAWITTNDPVALMAHYQGILPSIREAARRKGYAIGVHGSLRRDLDLIAVPWVADHASPDDLARAVQIAACGLCDENLKREEKPLGRMGYVLHIGRHAYIDLSVIQIATDQLAGAGGDYLMEAAQAVSTKSG